jgi:exonuclease III
MAKKPLDILQWNCRGLRASLPDLQTLVQDQQPAVICLQETKITDPDYNILTQYHHTRKLATTTSTLPKGGVSIFVNKHLLSSAITLRTTLQAVAVRVTLHTPVSICSIYLPPNSKWTAQDLQDIIQQLPAPTILLGDFNAHHPLWATAEQIKQDVK